MEITLSDEAYSDIADIAYYIGQSNPPAATRFLVAVRETVEFLSENPGAARLSERVGAEFAGLRQWSVRGFSAYLLFLRPEGKTMVILRVLHGARDIETILG